MSELTTSLALMAYGIAAVVGMQLVANGFFHLSRRAVRRNGRSVSMSPNPHPQAVLTALVLLAAGLFLLLQGAVVALWTLG